jgi:hypothetical protein
MKSGRQQGNRPCCRVFDPGRRDRGRDGLIPVQEPERLPRLGFVQSFREGAVRHPVARQVIRPVLNWLASERSVDVGVERQQMRGRRDAEEERPLASGEGSQDIEMQGWLAGKQHRPHRRQVGTCQ